MSSESLDISEEGKHDIASHVNVKHFRRMRIVLVTLSVLVFVFFLIFILQSILLVVLMFGENLGEQRNEVEHYSYPFFSKDGKENVHRGIVTTSRKLEEPVVVFKRDDDLFMMYSEENDGYLFVMKLDAFCCKKKYKDDCRRIYMNVEYEYVGLNEEDCKIRGLVDFPKYFPYFLKSWDKKCDDETEFLKGELLGIKKMENNIYECRGHCKANTFEEFLEIQGGRDVVLEEIFYVTHADWELKEGEERGWPEPVRDDEKAIKELKDKFIFERDQWCDNRLLEDLEGFSSMAEARESFVEIHKFYCRVAGDIKPVPDRQITYESVCSTIESSILCNVRCPKTGNVLKFMEAIM